MDLIEEVRRKRADAGRIHSAMTFMTEVTYELSQTSEEELYESAKKLQDELVKKYKKLIGQER